MNIFTLWGNIESPYGDINIAQYERKKTRSSFMDNQQDRFADETNRINDDSGGEKEYPAEIKTPSGTSNVLRLLDGSQSFRKYSISWCLCDDDQIRPFIVENETQGKGVLARMLGDADNFFKGGYLESRKGQFGKAYVHQQKDPELFKRITEYWNPGYNGTGTARPKKEYVFNAIHRNPETVDGRTFNWCAENKHTKLIRLGQRAMKSLKMVRDNSGEFTVYDIVFSKQGSGADTIFGFMKGDIGTQYNVVGPLTEAELQYERYDLDYITSLASAGYVLKNLRNSIERISAVMSVGWVAELEKQQAIEQAAYEAAKNGQVDQQVPPIVTTPPAASMAAPAAPAAFVRQPAVRVASPHVEGIPLQPCGHCQQPIPEGSITCPRCAGVLLSDCDICHKPFSVFSTKCPFCLTEYKTV